MPIDGCPYKFAELAKRELPKYLRKLDRALQHPRSARLFVRYGSDKPRLLSKLLRESDFPGCYVFVDGTKPIYVGISMNVVNRIRQHLNSDSPYSASLAFKMANHEREPKMNRDSETWTRAQAKAFGDKQRYLRRLRVAFVPIRDIVTMYLFEVNVAVQFDTSPWNTFKPH